MTREGKLQTTIQGLQPLSHSEGKGQRRIEGRPGERADAEANRTDVRGKNGQKLPKDPENPKSETPLTSSGKSHHEADTEISTECVSIL